MNSISIKGINIYMFSAFLICLLFGDVKELPSSVLFSSMTGLTVYLTFLPRHAGIHEVSTASREKPQTRNNFTIQ